MAERARLVEHMQPDQRLVALVGRGREATRIAGVRFDLQIEPEQLPDGASRAFASLASRSSRKRRRLSRPRRSAVMWSSHPGASMAH